MEPVDKKQDILNFTLPPHPEEDNHYSRVLLQLFGYAGHGKSAFVNSCFYTLSSEGYVQHAQTGASGNIITTKRNAYQLTDTITIVDNRGFGRKMKNEEAIVYAQLGNFFPLNEEVEWKNDFSEIMSQVEDSDLKPNYTDFIVPVFIYSMKTHMPEEQKEEVKEFFKNCLTMTGICPIVVLTNKYGKESNDLENIFKDARAEVVTAIENYTPEDHLKTRGRCAVIQDVIWNALQDVKFRLQQPRDPVRERLGRKKFLLNFVHKFIVKETAENAKNEEYERLKALAKKEWFRKFPYNK